jgi:predicted DNA-binding protein
MSQSSKPVPLAVPNELLTQIDTAASRTGRSRSELMRLAIEIGLADLKAINYDIASTISNAAHRPDLLALGAETPTSYSATGKQNRAG